MLDTFATVSLQQVTACEGSDEAIQILKNLNKPASSPYCDLIFKAHCPASGVNACGLLQKVPSERCLQGIPIIGILFIL